MSAIRTVTKSIGTTPEAGAGAGFQFYNGAGALEALVLNYGASADANTVVTAYDGVAKRATGAGADVLPDSGDRVTIYTRTSGTDAGTTVPVYVRGDADIVAGTATAGADGALQLLLWDGAVGKYRRKMALVGETGIEPNVPYKLDALGKFVRVEKAVRL